MWCPRRCAPKSFLVKDENMGDDDGRVHSRRSSRRCGKPQGDEITPLTRVSAYAMPMSVNGKSFPLHNSGAPIAFASA
jgi:hypothetical protein